MPPDASEQLRAIAERLRTAGAGVLFNDVRAEIRAEAEPLVVAVQEAAQRKLPKRGGLNEWVASQHITIQVLAGARIAGVRLRGPRNIRSGGQTNRGYVRHPLPNNNREHWVTQQIPEAAGWWTDTLREDSPLVTPRITAVITRVNQWIRSAI